MSEITKKILSPAEARKVLGFSKNKMYELLASDKTFPAFRWGGKWCINADKLQSWIDEKTENKR